MRARRYRPPRPSLYARHGQHLEVQALLGSRSYEPLARRQRPHREVGSEGSPTRMSRQRTVTSATTKRLSDKCGGAGAKAAALIRGDLVGSGRVKRDASPKTVGLSHVGPPAWWPTLRVNSANVDLAEASGVQAAGREFVFRDGPDVAPGSTGRQRMVEAPGHGRQLVGMSAEGDPFSRSVTKPAVVQGLRACDHGRRVRDVDIVFGHVGIVAQMGARSRCARTANDEVMVPALPARTRL